MSNRQKLQKVVVIGGGGHAKSVISIIKKISSFEIIGYVDIFNKGKILGISYLGKDQILENLPKKYDCHAAVIGVGNIDVSLKRKELMMGLETLGFKFPVVISPSAIINEDVRIAQGTVVLDRVILGSGVRVGRGVILNTGSVVDHDCRIGDFVHVAPGVVLSGGVKIGSGTLLGTGSRLIQDITVSKDCLIGAGAVVVKDCLKQGRYTGIPARLIEK